MKVLFLTRFFYPHIGGVEKHIQEVSLDLGKRGYEVTILTEKFDKFLKDQEIFEGIKVIRYNYPKIKFLGLIYIWFWLLKNRSLIKESDIIHCHDVFIWYFPFRFIYFRKPVYTTFHGWEGIWPIPLKFILLKRLAAKLSRRVICVGSYIGKYYGLKPDLIIYGATDTTLLYSDLVKERQRIVYVGRLEKDTGLPLLLKALHKYHATVYGSNVGIDFCGDGSLRKECEGAGDVHGFVDPGPYLQKAAICFASGYLSIFEAFANRCLVLVGYDNPLKKDYYSQTPFSRWIIRSASESNLRQKIEYLLKNPERLSGAVKQSSEWIKTQTWENVAKQYERLWHV